MFTIFTSFNQQPGSPTLFVARLTPKNRPLADYNLISVSRIDYKHAIANLRRKAKKLNISIIYNN